MPEPIEVTGPIEVRLWISSTAEHTDVTAKLIDAYPPSASHPAGYALNLTDSIIRLPRRTGAPDDITEVTITLYPTANLFAAGHRIRVDVSSSNFPRFDVNPNAGAPADNTVWHNRLHPSHVLLPIIPTPGQGV